MQSQIILNSFKLSIPYSLRLLSTAPKDIPVQKRLVPLKPIPSKIDQTKLPPRTKIDANTIAHLERLSLVDCANKKGIETLEDAIAFADQILQVDTKGIEPLITPLEDRPLQIREDEVAEGNCLKEVLSNANVIEDGYFVAPPGNIPLEPRDNLLHEDKNN
ncbi:hypothetical protein FQR65_LT02113 [Abscondita terminalis]|nr:hypothetical protein FQR65_LT02113 [Abscondita terminalis]